MPFKQSTLTPGFFFFDLFGAFGDSCAAAVELQCTAEKGAKMHSPLETRVSFAALEDKTRMYDVLLARRTAVLSDEIQAGLGIPGHRRWRRG